MKGSRKSRQHDYSSAAANLSPITGTKRTKSTGFSCSFFFFFFFFFQIFKDAAVDDSYAVIGGDSESFVTQSFMNTTGEHFSASASASSAKLLEIKERVQSMARGSKDPELDLLRARVSSTQMERQQAEERLRTQRQEEERAAAAVAMATTKNNGSSSSQGGSKSVVVLEDMLARKEQEIHRLQLELQSAKLVAHHSQQAMNSFAEERRSRVASATADLADVDKRGLSGTAGSSVLQAELAQTKMELKLTQDRLRSLDNVHVENKRMRSLVADLENEVAKRKVADESDKNTLRLREEIAALKQKELRSQGFAAKLAKCEAALEEANAKLAKWKVVVSDEFPSMEHVQNTMGALQGKINTLSMENAALLESNRAMEARIRQHDAQVGALAKERDMLREQTTQLKHTIAQSVSEIALLREAKKSTQYVLEEFNKEGSTFGNYDAAKSSRIAQLEEELKAQTQFLEQSQAGLRSVTNQLEETRERIFVLESRLTAGEFNPETVQVLHLRMNPTTTQGNGVEHKIALLTEENESLKKRLAAARQQGASSTEIETLKKQNVALAKRADRMKEIAHQKISEFREIIGLLFGYRVDLEFDVHIYTLTPISDSTKKLKFKGASAGTAVVGNGIRVGDSAKHHCLSGRIRQHSGFSRSSHGGQRRTPTMKSVHFLSLFLKKNNQKSNNPLPPAPPEVAHAKPAPPEAFCALSSGGMYSLSS